MSLKQIEFIKKCNFNKRLIIFFQILILVICISLWEYNARNGSINTFIYSSPSLIIETIKNLYISNNLFIHIYTTVYETIIAFTLGIVLGFIISVLLYSNKFLAKVLEPYLIVFNSLPKVALGPLIIIIFGAGNKSIIIMALLINLIVNITTIYNGFLNTDKLKINLVKSFGGNNKAVLKYIVIPSSYNTIISSMKLNISLSLIGVIMGEYLVSRSGIGYLIIYGTQIFNLSMVMSAIFILTIISFVLYNIVIILEKKLIKNLT